MSETFKVKKTQRWWLGNLWDRFQNQNRNANWLYRRKSSCGSLCASWFSNSKMRWMVLALTFALAGCSTTGNSKKRMGPGMHEDSQDLRVGGYVN